jgi:hypothetical protein
VENSSEEGHAKQSTERVNTRHRTTPYGWQLTIALPQHNTPWWKLQSMIMKERAKIVLATLCVANISIPFQIFIRHIKKNFSLQVGADIWQHVHS